MAHWLSHTLNTMAPDGLAMMKPEKQQPWYDLISSEYSGPWFNIKMSSYQCRKSHRGDKTIIGSSYLHNGISYTGKMSSLYWISALVSKPVILWSLQSPRWTVYMTIAMKSDRHLHSMHWRWGVSGISEWIGNFKDIIGYCTTGNEYQCQLSNYSGYFWEPHWLQWGSRKYPG